MNVIKSTWAFKIKRFPNGLLREPEACFCVYEDIQIEGVQDFDTFTPVVQWTTIHTPWIREPKLTITHT